MPGNFLEQLLAEWYEYRGFVVRTNERVAKRAKGGHGGELDVLAFHPGTHEFVHIETSCDADSWTERENKFAKKFETGRLHAASVFPDLVRPGYEPRPVAVLVFASTAGR